MGLIILGSRARRSQAVSLRAKVLDNFLARTWPGYLWVSNKC